MSGSSRKPGRRTSLPPELDSIDSGWGDEEPTIARKGPTGQRSSFASEPPTLARNLAPNRPQAPDAPLIERSDDRETPVDHEASEHVPIDERLPVADHPSERVTAPPPANFDAELESASAPSDPAAALELEDDPFERPTLEGEPPGFVEPTSDAPTVPPFSEQPTAGGRAVASWPDPAEATPIKPLSLEPAAPDSDHHRRRGATTRRDRPRDEPPAGEAPQEPQPTTAAERFVRDMNDRFAMGDFSGALQAAEAVLDRKPSHVDATSMAAKCREVLYDMYSSRLGSFDRIPVICMAPDQIRWLSLDHRAGFLLSMIDGISSVDDLLDVSGMAKLDAMRILSGLVEQKVIKLE